MNIKESFLNLTEYTIPYGYESDVAHLLPDNIIEDDFGNYFISIGDSKTLFTCHLDSFCRKKEKVNHIIDGNIIKTDGKTILGGDNKAGVVVLLYMIEHKIPGTYYFFIGEEPLLTNGLIGSNYLKKNTSFLKKFKRAIAFDRKKTGSIITRQMAQECCSIEFTNALINEFKNCGLIMKGDPNGYYTDTGNFIELIPECTNISVGVWNEHYKDEYVDISYVEQIAKAACKIKWEKLPSNRIPKWDLDDSNTKLNLIKNYNKFSKRKNDINLFKKIVNILDDKNYMLMNKNKFESDKVMTFNNWFDNRKIEIVISDGKVKFNGNILPIRKNINKSIEHIIKRENL